MSWAANGSSGHTLDDEIRFIDTMAADLKIAALRGYLIGLRVRYWDFSAKRQQLNEGARGQLRGRVLVHLGDIVGGGA
jgi:hypothetical protein